MSRIRANEITNQNANGAPNFPNGITVTGVVTATTLTQNIIGDLTVSGGDLTVSGNVGVGGTLTYEDVTNIDSVGVITARSTVSIADSIVHIGDTNTSLRFPAADTITAETGGSERLRITADGAIGIGSTNFGTAGQVLVSQGPSSAPTWSGGTTRTLEYISAPCSNESIATFYGSRTTQQVSGVQNLTSTYEDVTGSSITYRPPVGAHTVIYRFSFQFSQSDADPIVHFRFHVGGDEIIYARHTKRGDDHQDRTTFEWPIRIDGSQADNLNHGRLQSWNADKVLKMRAREYSGDYEAKLHVTQNWDGSGTDMFSMPVITIIALGS